MVFWSLRNVDWSCSCPLVSPNEKYQKLCYKTLGNTVRRICNKEPSLDMQQDRKHRLDIERAKCS